MQSVRQRLDVRCDLRSLTFQRDRPAMDIERTGRKSPELDREQSEALTDVVVKISGDAAPFIFLRGNEPAAQARKSFGGPLLLADITQDFRRSH